MIKKIMKTVAICATIIGSAVSAENENLTLEQKIKEGKTINIFVDGSSAAGGLREMLPKLARADGIKVNTVGAYLMRAPLLQASVEGWKLPEGKTIEECAKGIKKNSDLRNAIFKYGYTKMTFWEETKNGFERNKAKREAQFYHLATIFKEKQFDVVVLSVNTHFAMIRDLFKTSKSDFEYISRVNKTSGLKTPTAKNPGTVTVEYKVECIRKLLPNTKIFLFQNLAPRNDCGYKLLQGTGALKCNSDLAKGEILTEDKWTFISTKHFARCAKELDISPIFPNDILYWVRNGNYGYNNNVPNYIEAAKLYDTKKKGWYPEWEYKYDFRYNFKWKGANIAKKGKRLWATDHHPNAYGEYMTGAIAYEMIFNKSVVGNTYLMQESKESGTPGINKREITSEEWLKLIQKAVHEIRTDKSKYPLYNSPDFEKAGIPK